MFFIATWQNVDGAQTSSSFVKDSSASFHRLVAISYRRTIDSVPRVLTCFCFVDVHLVTCYPYHPGLPRISLDLLYDLLKSLCFNFLSHYILP